MIHAINQYLNQSKWQIYLSIGLIFLYFIPYMVAGENATLTQPDNMDSNVVWAKMTGYPW